MVICISKEGSSNHQKEIHFVYQNPEKLFTHAYNPQMHILLFFCKMLSKIVDQILTQTSQYTFVDHIELCPICTAADP